MIFDLIKSAKKMFEVDQIFGMSQGRLALIFVSTGIFGRER